ncbi:hypothetical protein [Secundilactobacillus collinoides]|uniref:hypothetical protein n=1 Tax=Secundilactobacillus collinoides TaxID=33960 RepID=UPI0006D276D5|nr:hypothetical protein [Secundilactobacillus collinoides]
MMTQPELASDDIISRLHLPTLRKLLDDLSLDYDQLENNVASQADLHKKRKQSAELYQRQKSG